MFVECVKDTITISEPDIWCTLVAQVLQCLDGKKMNVNLDQQWVLEHYELPLQQAMSDHMLRCEVNKP